MICSHVYKKIIKKDGKMAKMILTLHISAVFVLFVVTSKQII